MGIEIKWTIDIPETGERHWILAEKFAGTWHFKRRRFRRDVWVRFNDPTREMWEHILEQLHRRYRRREGVSDEDIAHVTKILRELPVPRPFQDESSTPATNPVRKTSSDPVPAEPQGES
ncbi:MAG: hypothetical protein SNJ82_11025 [Gemmataceae bacterium]